MAGKTRGGDTERPGNVVSLFGSSDGPTLAVDMRPEEIEQAKQIMVDALENVIKSIRNGETDGIILIGMRTEGEYGAESYMGGVGVFGQVDRAVGIMEMVQQDLIKQARRSDD